MVRAYWGTVLSVDDSVGRLVAHLKATGQYDNTVIVFMGDNGLLEGEHGMVDKRTMHDPAFASRSSPAAPGCPPARSSTDRSSPWTLAPSLLELCGAPALENIQGRSWKTRESRRPRMAHRVVLRIQLREAVPLHAEHPRHSHRRLEIHPLPARRRLARQAPRGALRSAQRSRRTSQPRRRSPPTPPPANDSSNSSPNLLAAEGLTPDKRHHAPRPRRQSRTPRRQNPLTASISFFLFVILSAAKNPARPSHLGKRRADPNRFFAPRRLTDLF
jgi:hypothetical protein